MLGLNVAPLMLMVRDPAIKPLAAGETEPGLITLHAGHLEFKGKDVHLSQGITGKTSEYSFDADGLVGTLTAPWGRGSTARSL